MRHVRLLVGYLILATLPVTYATLLEIAYRVRTRRLWRVLGYLIIASLALTFFTIIEATIAGIMYTKFSTDRINNSAHAFAQEMDFLSSMDPFSIPGAVSTWQHMEDDEPFYVPQLTSQKWHSNMGFTLPRGYGADVWDSGTRIDKMVSLKGLVRDASTRSAFPNEWWVFASNQKMPALSPWDAAFQELVEYHYVHPLPNGTALASIQCESTPFLCNAWQLDGLTSAAMVHFLVQEANDPDMKIDAKDYDVATEDLRQVEVRIIDLGFRGDISPVAPGLFQSEYEQLKSLTGDNKAYTIFEEYGHMSREFDRFVEYFEVMAKKEGSALKVIDDLDTMVIKYLAKPLRLDDAVQFLGTIVFMISAVMAMIVSVIFALISSLARAFLRTPTKFDFMARRLTRNHLTAALSSGFEQMMQNISRAMESNITQDFATPTTSRPPGITDARTTIKIDLTIDFSKLASKPSGKS